MADLKNAVPAFPLKILRQESLENKEIALELLGALSKIEKEKEKEVQFEFKTHIDVKSTEVENELKYTLKNKIFTNHKESLYPSDVVSFLRDIVDYFQIDQEQIKKWGKIINSSEVLVAASARSHPKISEEQEAQVREILQPGDIQSLCEDIINFLEQEPETPEEETPEEEAVAAAEEVAPAEETAPEAEAEADTDSAGAEEAVPEDEQPKPKPEDLKRPEQPPPPPPDPGHLLNYKPFQTNAAIFQTIALRQLELFYDLPEGSLENTRGKVASEAMSYLLSLSDADRQDLLNNPEVRSKYFKQFYWQLLHNHLIIAELQKVAHLISTEKLEAAQKGADFNDLLTNVQADQDLQKIEPLPPLDTQYKEKFRQVLLEKIGDPVKAQLAFDNVTNTIQALIVGNYSVKILDQIDSGKFKIIFGNDISFNPDLLEIIKEYWVLERAYFSQKFGSKLVNNELSDSALNELSKLSDEIVKKQIAAPVTQIRSFVSHGATVEDVAAAKFETNPENLNDTSKKIRSNQNDQTWLEISINERASILMELGKQYDEFGQLTDAINSQHAPDDLVPAELSAAASPYPNALFSDGQPIDMSPFGLTKGESQAARTLKDLVRGEIKKKFKKQAEAKLASAATGKLLGKAAGAINPAVGLGLALLSTKKGRRVLAIGGLAALHAIIQTVSTVGGTLFFTAGFLIGSIAGAPVGVVTGLMAGEFGAQILPLKWRSIFGSGDIAAGTRYAARGIGSTAYSGAKSALSANKLATPEGAIGAQTLAPNFVNPATVSVIGALGGTAAISLLTIASIQSAMLADFPVNDPRETFSGIAEQRSQYVDVEKQVLVPGCPENRCENPTFPLTAQYTITIRPKENYSITLSSVTDTITTRHSKKTYEELGQSVPNTKEIVRSMEDFPEIGNQQVISPGEELTIIYEQTFDESYNHASVVNTFQIDFNWVNPDQTGSAQAITGAILALGDTSSGAGCWPVSGTITQLSHGSQTHQKRGRWGGMDAIDIGAPVGAKIYSPFSGRVCVNHRSDTYGNALLLESDEGQFIFAHLSQYASGLSDNTCLENVQPGDLIGFVGNTGASTDPHLHFERLHNGAYFSFPNDAPTIIETLFPPTNKWDPVTSCYEN